ncbi:MAG: peptidase M16 [Cyanobacteria bacterium SW_9_44_58]|nr:MAG: peptidase M16 [Cyanobacteria bacterium SW_9_44_58]
MSHFISPTPTENFPARVFQLNNGLTIIHQQLTTTPVVVTDVWVNAGTRQEPWQGIAHFLEHLIFKGTKRIPPGWFDYVIENCGGMANAETSYDYAHFFLTTAGTYWQQTLPYLAELLLQAEIPEEEFLCERNVVLEEIREMADDPDYFTLQALCESLYDQHPYGRSILGTEEELLARSPNQMRCFHRTYYQPHNMTVVVVGDVDQQTACQGIESAFYPFSVPSECPPFEIPPQPKLTTPQRREIRLPRLEIARLVMGWRCIGIEGWHDAVGLDLLSVLLGQGSYSRLVQELREEKQLVQEIASSFSLQQDSSLFTINVWLPAQHLYQVESILRDRVQQLQSQPVSEKELKRAQGLLCNDYAFSTETPGQLAGLYGYYSILAQPELAWRYPTRIRQLEPAELQRLAQTYLSTQQYAVTIMKPF